jgi:hypothetical protein
VYDLLFEATASTAIFTVLLTMAASVLVGAGRMWWRVLAFNYSPAIAAAFFLVASLSDVPTSRMDLSGGFIFEFVVLCIYCRLLADAFRDLHRVELGYLSRLMRTTSILQSAFMLRLLLADGFGIFSEGSRIDYLSTSFGATYMTYASILVAAVQAGLVARRVTLTGKIGLDGTLVMALNLLLSVLAGSKGAILLWLLSVMALIKYQEARVSKTTVAVVLLVAAISVGLTAYLVSNFLSIEVGEFFELAFGRVLLTNDARALAIDLRSTHSNYSLLVNESLRSLSSLFGNPPANEPLGMRLYADSFGSTGITGANTSLVALILFYAPSGSSLVFALGASIVALAMYAAVRAARLTLSNPGGRYVLQSMGMVSISVFSQDFLAFQIVVPLAVLTLVALWIGPLFVAGLKSGSTVARRRCPQR